MPTSNFNVEARLLKVAWFGGGPLQLRQSRISRLDPYANDGRIYCVSTSEKSGVDLGRLGRSRFHNQTSRRMQVPDQDISSSQ